jgi:hypothetical protein
MPLFGEEIEGLSLDAGGWRDQPLEMFSSQLGIRRVTRVRPYGLDGGGAIFGFLSAGNVCQPETL